MLNKIFIPNEAIDLLGKISIYDRTQRIIPKETKFHFYFKNIGDVIEKEQIL